jgi:hypothetical protein
MRSTYLFKNMLGKLNRNRQIRPEPNSANENHGRMTKRREDAQYWWKRYLRPEASRL